MEFAFYICGLIAILATPVSYTHLDVYKRQAPEPAHSSAVSR